MNNLEVPRWKQTLAAMRYVADRHDNYRISITGRPNVVTYNLQKYVMHPIESFCRWVDEERVVLISPEEIIKQRNLITTNKEVHEALVRLEEK